MSDTVNHSPNSLAIFAVFGLYTLGVAALLLYYILTPSRIVPFWLHIFAVLIVWIAGIQITHWANGGDEA